MTILMDDPTTYLKKDTEDVVLMLAASLAKAQDACRQYGVSIQVNMPGNVGVRALLSYTDVTAAIAVYPPTTPWCLVDGGISTDTPNSRSRGYDAMTLYFGPAKTVAKALGVETDGIAWRPDKYPVTG